MNDPFTPEDLSHRFAIGIDLGTTNSAVAYVDLSRKEGPGRNGIRFLEIPQIVAPGETAGRRVLPSFLYLPGPYELPQGSTALPWDKKRRAVVGEFAREQGALVPGRLVSSAKSWLAHGGVDRTAPILPWGESEAEKKVSPVEASARYLQHIREAWDEAIAKGREGWFFEEQLIILTVPASFDEVARELTVSAAHEAGISRVVLLEEPLAAFYAWLSRHESDWQENMEAGQLIWVCDVGGGTTDFTVVAIREGEKGLRFDRLAVGDHLMLGGDNMDFTLGRRLEKELTGQPGKLDSKRWYQLVYQCRKAKEALLGSEEEDAKADIVVMGSGGKLIGGTLRGTLTREEVRRLILEGFFPGVSLEDLPESSGRRGLTEWGLPYVQDPAVTRHLAAFWRRFEKLLEDETGRSRPYPDYLLFNGGALAPAAIRERLSQVVRSWFEPVAGEQYDPKELENPYPDLAVAIGAAYYGLVRLGEGVRIGAGSPRAYYVEVAGKPHGAEGEDRREAVCLVPRGTEEGFETQLERPAFEVLANRPVSFQLFSSSTRLGDRIGEVVGLSEEEISVFPPIRTVLRFGKKSEERKLPVKLAVGLTEVGTLELWCRSQQTPHRWQLQFDVRQEVDPSSASEVSGETLDASLIETAQERIRETFNKENVNERPPERLVKELEALLETPKEKWPTPLIRKLADALIETQHARGLTPQHESRWLNLLGFCLRPGYGDPVDEWRMKEVWKFYLQGLRFPKQASSRLELWIFLRRVAGGLSAGRQLHLHQEIFPYLQAPGSKKGKSKAKLPKRPNVQEELEIWMAAASLERLPVDAKVSLGRALLERVKKKTRPQELWALGRLGARVPLYGPIDRVVPSSEASVWLKSVLSLEVRSKDAAAHAAVQLARLTGDRQRDVSEEDRRLTQQWLEGDSGYDSLRTLLTEGRSGLSRQEQDWMFGESLPTGLVLADSGSS